MSIQVVDGREYHPESGFWARDGKFTQAELVEAAYMAERRANDGGQRVAASAASDLGQFLTAGPSRAAGNSGNPLLAQLLATAPEVYSSAMASGEPPPSMWEGGDLPVVTASGAPPAILRSLPWPIRYAAAAAPSYAALYALTSGCGDPSDPDAVAAELIHHSGDAEVVSYRDRFETWVARNMSEDQLSERLFGQQSDVTEPPNPPAAG